MDQAKKTTILLVDDEVNNIKLLEAILKSDGHVVQSATNGEKALVSVATQIPDLILLDIMMPGIDGFEVMRRLKADPHTSSIPIILLTALSDNESRIKGLSEGGEEFLSKPVDRTELLIRVRNLLKMKEYQTSLETHNATLSEHILWLAHFDMLTGLPNRALLLDRITLALSIAKRNHTCLAIMFLDLDRFKNINDTLGHDIGDKMLIEVANCLKSLMREQDTVSRPGGDEFIIVLPDTNANGAARLAEKLLANISHRFQIKQYDLLITTSIGIAIYPDDGENFEVLSKHADTAMYLAKSEGRNTFRFFSQEMQVHAARILQLENALPRALECKQMYLNFQPQVSLQDGCIIGAEALLRWKHPKLGNVSPTEFIPIAESNGQILGIGEWVLRTAIHQLKSWIDRGMAPMIIAVNLSVAQFRHPHLPQLIVQILEEAKLPPQYLELELTESVAMEDPVRAIAMMNNLHELGIRTSIDDFGTGFSSLSYLNCFHVNKLKIDQSFVSHLDKEKAIVITAIISMARSLGIHTTAEGVTNKKQRDFLCKQGCNEMQGTYVSKPLPADQFEIFVKNFRQVKLHAFEKGEGNAI